MTTRTITALFDSVADAERAADRLTAVGIDRNTVSIVRQDATAVAPETAERREEGGFFNALADLFMPDEDRYTYAEGIRRGGALLTASVDDALADEAIRILDDAGAVDLDTRASEWRAAGWRGYEPAAGAGYGTTTTGATEGEEAIPVMEEQLRVGKRETGRGNVRVRSYVVERPVEEQVRLREESVRVERRPVDRPIEPGDAAFQERTIEMTETREEAVVDKTARVTEEVVVGKDVKERTETVGDTVRKTEVEVEDEGDRATTPRGPTDR